MNNLSATITRAVKISMVFIDCFTAINSRTCLNSTRRRSSISCLSMLNSVHKQTLLNIIVSFCRADEITFISGARSKIKKTLLLIKKWKCCDLKK